MKIILSMRASQHVVKRSLMTCAHISALPLQGFLPLTRVPLTKIIEHAHSKALRAGACVLRKESPALTAGTPYENKKPNETFISLSLTATTINCPYGSTYIFKLQVIFCFFYTISVHLGTEVPVPRYKVERIILSRPSCQCTADNICPSCQ